MSLKTFLSINEEFTECTICLKSWYLNDPRQLKCGHSFCKDCLEEMFRSLEIKVGGKFSCPTCRCENQLNGVENLIPNLTLRNAKKIEIFEETNKNKWFQHLQEGEMDVIKEIDDFAEKVKKQIDEQVGLFRQNINQLYDKERVECVHLMDDHLLKKHFKEEKADRCLLNYCPIQNETYTPLNLCWFKPNLSKFELGKLMTIRPFNQINTEKTNYFTTNCLEIDDFFVGQNLLIVSRVVQIKPNKQIIVSEYTKIGNFIRDLLYLCTDRTSTAMDSKGNCYVSDHQGDKILICDSTESNKNFTVWVSIWKPITILYVENVGLIVTCPHNIFCLHPDQTILWQTNCQFDNPISLTYLPDNYLLYVADWKGKAMQTIHAESGLIKRANRWKGPINSITTSATNSLILTGDSQTLYCVDGYLELIDTLNLNFKPGLVRNYNFELDLKHFKSRELFCSERFTSRIMILQ